MTNGKSIENITRHDEVSEKSIERYLVSRVKEAGGVCLKYANANMTGYPDRVILLPHGKTAWVELKSAGKKPTKLQAIRIQAMRDLGREVHVIDNREMVDKLIKTTQR